MNISTLAWDKDLLGLFGLTGITLPAIVSSGRAFGTTATPAEMFPSSPASATSRRPCSGLA